MGPIADDRTRAFLDLVHGYYNPAQVVIHIDPSNPPKRLAMVNDAVKALLEVKEDAPSLRICEGGVCGLPITDFTEARLAVV